MKIHPRPGNVYVVLDAKSTEYTSDKGFKIDIPESASQQTRAGTVIEIGKIPHLYPWWMFWKKREKPWLAVGDRVIIPFYAGTFINWYTMRYKDERHKVLGIDEIMAKISNEEIERPEVDIGT
jgi:co-chaperonin GroES (HSP10)